MAHRQKTDAKIRYLIQRATEPDVVMEIPASWKITFGYVNPAKSGDGFRNREGHCLRIYEGEKVRAALGNVTGFRDLSLPLARKFEKESGESKWESDSEGNFSRESNRSIESGFVVEAEEVDFGGESDD